MKFQLGLSILLALIVGLICISSVRCLYLEEPKEEVILSNTHLDSSPPTSIEQAFEEKEPSENEDSQEKSKRNDIGMPSSSQGGTMMENDQGVSQEKSPQESGSRRSSDDESGSTGSSQSSGVSEDEVETVSSADHSDAKVESTARGLGSQLVSSLSSVTSQSSANQQEAMDQPNGSTESLPAPVIIENDRRVSPPVNSPNGQPKEQQELNQNKQARMGPTSSTEIELPSTTFSNSSLPPSTARTFESWTNCVGASSNKYGTCKNDVECKKHKGQDDGSCMGGLGVCCVMALTCGDKSLENNTFFANPDFPEPSWEARLCEVEIKKKHKKILQIMIEFEEFEIAPPNHDGECHTDVFQVKLASNRPSPYSLLRMCGHNTGQHMYLDVSQVDEGIVLSVATSGGGFPRRWSIRIVQMDDKNFLLAPPGCLQYYTDTVGHFRSFNLGRNLRNLYYAICFRIDNGYSGIKFTSNFFGMHGPNCKRRMNSSMIGGRYNASYEAHPHHLVIPPPGYAPPPPPPRYDSRPPPPHSPQMMYGSVPQPPRPIPTYQPQHPRYKRYAYSEPTDTVGSGERYPRTFGHHHEMKDHKFEEKELKHEHEHPIHHPHEYRQPYGPGYGSGYGPEYGHHPGAYGPPPHPYSYGHSPGYYAPSRYYEHSKTELKEEKFGPKFEEKVWSKGLLKDKKEESFGLKHEGKFGYGPPHGYGQMHQYGPQYSGYSSGYGGSYGGGYGYGEYHHKEIDKFGKKYEHLEYKHEKNHLKKEEKDEKKESKWWPSWGKKEEKKDKKHKDKFTQHHEALFPMMHIPEMPHCEPRFCGANDVITFPPSGDSLAEMCGNRFNRGRGPKIISGSPLVVYVSNRGHNRGAGFDMNYEQIFYLPKPY